MDFPVSLSGHSGMAFKGKITILGVCSSIGIIGTKILPGPTNKTIPSDRASRVYHNHKALIN